MPPAGARTHYQVLGVTPDASSEQVRRAHRQLARVLHPDTQAGLSPAERALADRRMREVNAAWTVLSDPVRRAEYDHQVRAAAARPTNRSTSSGATAARATTTRSAATGRSPSTSSSTSRHATHSAPGGERANGQHRGRSGYRERSGEVDRGLDDSAETTGFSGVAVPAAPLWLFRRGPVVIALMVGLAIFVVTAYAGANSISGDGDAPSTTVRSRMCARKVEGRTAVPVDCAAPNDGRVVTIVEKALDCPDQTSYVVIDSRLVCVTNDPGVTSDPVPIVRD